MQICGFWRTSYFSSMLTKLGLLDLHYESRKFCLPPEWNGYPLLARNGYSYDDYPKVWRDSPPQDEAEKALLVCSSFIVIHSTTRARIHWVGALVLFPKSNNPEHFDYMRLWRESCLNMWVSDWVNYQNVGWSFVSSYCYKFSEYPGSMHLLVSLWGGGQPRPISLFAYCSAC